MSAFDVFNGDADGILALHQWRLAHPLDATLVTGIKREIALLARVPAGRAKRVAVFDISLDTNRDALHRLLDARAEVLYFDHHYAGEIPQHAGLTAHIDTSAHTCTSLLVDRALGGMFRPWAIAAAFGDNANETANQLAQEHGLNLAQTALLEKLGTSINYNAYGEQITDLHVHPAELYASLHAYTDPFAFIAQCPMFSHLSKGMATDYNTATSLLPYVASEDAALYLMPDAPWARRIGGIFANSLVDAHPNRAHAIVTPDSSNSYTVSVRAPQTFPQGADALCRQFPNGGGRARAAGINRLSAAALQDFQQRFMAHFDARTRQRDAAPAHAA